LRANKEQAADFYGGNKMIDGGVFVESGVGEKEFNCL
jgi:hypothetical protein